MAHEFPLYDILSKEVEQKELCYNIIDICKTINRLLTEIEESEALEHYSNISALILHHYYLENKSFPKDNIYGAKISNESPMIFTFRKLPEKLQKIIVAYLLLEN
jgi:hypothetical protein